MTDGERDRRETTERELFERYEGAGQSHVLAGWDELDGAGRARFRAELEGVDLDLVAELGALLHAPAPAAAAAAFEPPEVFPLVRGEAEAARAREGAARGEELLAEGRVGFLLVAGGQASRLGYDGPKGAFPVGPLSRRSLFEAHARRLGAVRARYAVATPWYVMTSPANDAATRAFFEQHGHFGLDPGDVRFFVQRMNPALDFEGRILRSGPGALFLAPDGHGGSLGALARSGCLADARARDLAQLSYFQVDNPLVRPADPLFLGLHAGVGAGMSAKVVEKRDPGEKVGVLGRADGRLGCIEYSDLPAGLREARTDDRRLLFGAGNIAVHLLERGFVERLVGGDLRLPWHVARKDMKVWGGRGPTVVRGAKFETFVFDALAESEHSCVLEVARAAEFSPVKNAEGEDSPATARADLLRLHAGWVAAAGAAPPPVGADGLPRVEICPSLAEDAAGFAARVAGRLEPRTLEGGHFYA